MAQALAVAAAIGAEHPAERLIVMALWWCVSAVIIAALRLLLPSIGD